MTQYGLTDWSDVEIKTGQKKNDKDLYLKLKNGNNVLRIITKPHEFLVHQYKAHKNDPGFGQRVMSSIVHGSDPLIEMGFQPRRRWLVGVIDRESQSYKILDLSTTAFKGIQELAREEDWGDPTQYDINIKVDKDAGSTGYYTVLPKVKKPLSPADIEIKSSADLEDLKRRCTPPTPEEVASKIAFIQSKSPNFNNGGAVADSAVAEESDDSVGGFDDDADFPAV
jgi:hypothetical protein